MIIMIVTILQLVEVLTEVIVNLMHNKSIILMEDDFLSPRQFHKYWPMWQNLVKNFMEVIAVHILSQNVPTMGYSMTNFPVSVLGGKAFNLCLVSVLKRESVIMF